jgi:DNA helicase IV
MAVATPGLRVPTSVRMGDATPRIVRVDSLVAGVVDEVAELRRQVPSGSVAVVAPDERCDAISDALNAAGFDHGRAATTGLDQSLTVVPVSVVKGLELDGVVVVEPAEIIGSDEHGLRALYVALTRSTQRLSVVHHQDLPPAMV